MFNTEQNYAPRESYAIAIPPSAKKSPRITSRPYKRQIPIPVDLAIELWRPVVGLEGIYQVSSKGRVRSLGRTSGLRYLAGKFLKTQVINKGYERVNLWCDEQKPMLVHRLVAMAFEPNPLGLPHVNHKDSNRLNNTWANLEWVTVRENVEHAIKYGGGCGGKKRTLPAGIVSRVINDYNQAVKSITQQQLSLKYGLSIRAVKKILRQNRPSSRHTQETLSSIVSDYRARKAIGLTTAMIAQRYNLSLQAIKKIVARANKNARFANPLTPQTPSSHE